MAHRRKSKRARRPGRSGVFVHRVLRALRGLTQAFRSSGPRGAHRPGPGRDRMPHRPTGKGGPRPTVWPWCTACSRRVAALCDRECGVCPSCCEGHPGDHPGGPLDGSGRSENDALGGDDDR